MTNLPVEKQRRYFVSFFMVHGEMGPTFGNCEVSWPVPLSSCHGEYGVNVLAEKIQEGLVVQGVVILSFQELPDPGIAVTSSVSFPVKS